METNEDFLQSSVFLEFCALLEKRCSTLSDECKWNCLAGGTAFFDELPLECRDDEPWADSDDVKIDCEISVMRSLWCYRQSMADGAPRADLEGIWNAVGLLAPNWVGFNPSRVRPRDGRDSERFSRELEEESERFNREIEESNAQNREANANRSRTAFDRAATRIYFKPWHWAFFGIVVIVISALLFAQRTIQP